MTYKMLLSAALALALGSSAAFAQDSGSVTDPVTKPLSGNEDGDQSTGDKAKSKAQKSTNRDRDSQSQSGASGPLDKAGNQNLSFGVLDINTDGKLTKDEAKSNVQLSSNFDKLDKDRNGSLNDSEFAAFESDDSGSTKAKKSNDGASAGSKRSPDSGSSGDSNSSSGDVKP